MINLLTGHLINEKGNMKSNVKGVENDREHKKSYRGHSWALTSVKCRINQKCRPRKNDFARQD